MPSATFDRLPPERREAIIQSAILEFSSTPYEKVSVFLIAKHAGMSRSGFYYYFTGKEDVYRYLLQLMLQEFAETLPASVDLFSIPERMLTHFAAFRGTPRQDFVSRVLDNMKPSLQVFFSEPFRMPEEPSTRLLGLDRLRSQTQESMQTLAFLLLLCTSTTLRQFYDCDMTLERARALLDEGLDIIKHGACKS